MSEIMKNERVELNNEETTNLFGMVFEILKAALHHCDLDAAKKEFVDQMKQHPAKDGEQLNESDIEEAFDTVIAGYSDEVSTNEFMEAVDNMGDTAVNFINAAVNYGIPEGPVN